MKTKLEKIIAIVLSLMLALALTSTFCVFAEDETVNLFDENMVCELADTAKYKSASEGTTLTEDEKDAVFVNGGEATYTISAVPETGWYMVSLSTRTNVNKKATYTITGTIGENSWNTVNVCSPAARTINIGSFYLEKGATVDINFAFSIAITSGLMPNVTLTDIKVARKNDISVSATEATKISALDYTNRVFRQGTTDDESLTYAITDGDEIGWQGKATILPKSAQYGIYNIDVRETAKYKVSMLLSKSQMQMNLFVDGSRLTKGATGLSEPVKTTVSPAYTTAYYTEIAEIVLVKGSHELMLQSANVGSGSTYFFAIKLEPVNDVKEVSATQKTKISFAEDYLKGEAFFGKLDTFSAVLESSTEPVHYGGIENEYVCDPDTSKVVQFTTDENYGTYAVDVKETGTYALSFVASRIDRQFNIYVDDELVRTKEYAKLDNYSKPCSPGLNYLVAEDHVCNLFLSEGVHKIRIENIANSSGVFHVMFLEKTNAEPVVILSDSNGEALDSICDGTMNVNVDLNGCGEDSVYFAIYEEKDGVKRLNTICQATVTAGVAEGAVTEFVKAEGKTYSAKVFVWYGKTIFGREYSF